MPILFQCLGISGLILLFYGFLALAITQAKESGFIIGVLILGALCLLAFLAQWIRKIIQNPSALRDMFESRSVKAGAGSVVYSIIAVLILLVINIYAVKRLDLKKDFTTDKIHTLSDQSSKLVANLENEVKVTVFMDERNQEKPMLKDLLRRYELKGDKLKVAFVDPDQDKITAEQFGTKDGDVLVQQGEQSHVTRSLDEEGITQALLKVTRNETPMVCFSSGHGELSLDLPNEDPRSLSYVKMGMENEGYESKAIDSLGAAVPSECGAVVVAGPTQAFTENEAGVLDAYLQQGGKLLLMLDPNVPDSRTFDGKLYVVETGLEKLSQKWGVDLGKNVVLEKQLQLFTGVQVVPTIRANNFGSHPIVEPLKSGGSVVFDRARSVSKKDATGITATELVFSASGESSWAQSDVNALFKERKVAVQGTDIQGSVPMAVAIEKSVDAEESLSDLSQMVVFGDADFASNAMIRSHEFNFDLLLNTLNWMLGETEQISIRAKAIKSSNIELSPEKANLIFYVAIILLPMLVLLFGLNLWWIRKQKG